MQAIMVDNVGKPPVNASSILLVRVAPLMSELRVKTHHKRCISGEFRSVNCAGSWTKFPAI
jgi:hypothetical protein